MNIYYGIIFFLIGTIMASFYGVVATRFPEGKSIIKPRSHCDSCNKLLKWYDLIPIFSFCFHKGKCHYCKAKLPIYEPIIEIGSGLLFMIAFFYYGFSYSFYISLILISLLVLIFISDFKYMIILDSPLVISGLLIFLLKWVYLDMKSALFSISYGFILFLFMLFIGFLGKIIFKRDALGGGDVKLTFIIGMVVGVPHGFVVLILSTFLALPYATFSLLTHSSREVPYGPFLISSLCLVFLYFDKFSYIVNLLTF